MEDALQAYLEYLKPWLGAMTVAPDLLRDPDHHGALIDDGPRPRCHQGFCGDDILEWDAPDAALGSDHATLSLARELARQGPMDNTDVLDLGCGTGLLGMIAARMGARVVATDLDPRAVELSRRNGDANGLSLDVRRGSLLDPVHGHEAFHTIIANLPHKPCPQQEHLPLGQGGMSEGDGLWHQALPDMARHLLPKGRLLFFLHSLPHPRIFALFQKHFDLTLLRWKLRWLSAGEYGDLAEAFQRRHECATSFLWHREGATAMVACVWQGTGKES